MRAPLSEIEPASAGVSIGTRGSSASAVSRVTGAAGRTGAAGTWPAVDGALGAAGSTRLPGRGRLAGLRHLGLHLLLLGSLLARLLLAHLRPGVE